MLSTLLALALTLAPVQDPVTAMALPAGNGAWTVKVFTAGGYTGQGAGDFAVSSDGQVVCNSAKCDKPPDTAELQRLVDGIVTRNEGVPATTPALVVPVVCSDCITWRLVLTHRDAMGLERTFYAAWTDGDGNTLPGMIQLYKAVIALKH